MTRFADNILRRQGRPVSYTPPGGSAIQTRAKVREVDEQARAPGESGYIAGDAVGFMSDEDTPVRGGVLEVAGAEYRIDSLLPGSAPGLVDLALTRLSGPAVHGVDFTAAVSRLGEPVVIDGADVRAVVNRAGVLLEENELGLPVETRRLVLRVRAADAPSVGMGSLVSVDGRTVRARSVRQRGDGTIELVC